MTLEKNSPCKVNLLLNILGRRPDGYHELETVMQPIRLHDRLVFERTGQGIQLSCSEPGLPTDRRNLVHRAATAFFTEARIGDGIRIHLEKRIPLAAGLGGGSGNAATTLLGLNELFQEPLSRSTLFTLAASLGSDVPFFLQSKPALATGRGEQIEVVEPFVALRGSAFLLLHPGFGISTAWAYGQLRQYPSALNGQPGRARQVISLLQKGDLAEAGAGFYNALEAPALGKYPYLALLKEYLRKEEAPAVLMSGSGSTLFAALPSRAAAERLQEKVGAGFGAVWSVVVPV
jgi:4-diphosphocytidyl-2-C-methyl-D-erythritol kinase